MIYLSANSILSYVKKRKTNYQKRKGKGENRRKWRNLHTLISRMMDGNSTTSFEHRTYLKALNWLQGNPQNKNKKKIEENLQVSRETIRNLRRARDGEKEKHTEGSPSEVESVGLKAKKGRSFHGCWLTGIWSPSPTAEQYPPLCCCFSPRPQFQFFHFSLSLSLSYCLICSFPNFSLSLSRK